jgi:hypothetical protein
VAFANKLLAARGIHIELDEGLPTDAATPVEKIIAYLLDHYGEYVGSEPRFDRAHAARVLDHSLPFPELGEKFYLLLLEYARSQQWQSLMDRVREEDTGHARPVLQTSETIVGAEVAGNAVF